MIGIRLVYSRKPALYIGEIWKKKYAMFVIDVAGMIYIYADFLREVQKRLLGDGIETDIFNSPREEPEPSPVTPDQALEKVMKGYLVTNKRFEPDYFRGKYWVITWGDEKGDSYIIR